MNKTNTVLNIRINNKMKREVGKIFSDHGFDLSSGVKTLLKSVIDHKTMSFEPRTVNGYTVKKEKELLKEIKAFEAKMKKGKIKGYSSAEEMHRAILGNDVYDRKR